MVFSCEGYILRCNITFHFYSFILYFQLCFNLGTQEDLAFEKTTLANIDPNHAAQKHYMWAHVLIGFLFFPISILIMKRFSVDLQFSEYDKLGNKTLMISKIPRKACHKKDDITKYFKVGILQYFFCVPCNVRTI